MNAANKKKIAEILVGGLTFPPESERHPIDVIIEFLKSVNFEVIERDHEEGFWGDHSVSYRRLLPPPKDNKKSVCVKVWSYDGPGRSSLDPQIWVRLDRDVALKILILGTFPETIQPEV